MNYTFIAGSYLLAYLIGAIPFGFLLVKLTKGLDIRNVQSGRIGGTNTMRAAGLWAGLSTAVLDVTKGFFVVKVAALFSEFKDPRLLVFIPIFAILGHNYSIFMLTRNQEGKIKLAGGAGGAVCLGGSIGLWWPSGLIILAIGIVVFYFIGYASITTLSVAFLSALIFSFRALSGLSPWVFTSYGVISLGLLILALIPNIKSLIAGTERLHGYRARRKKNNEQSVSSS